MTRALALAALCVALPTTAAFAEPRPPVKDCGDMLDRSKSSGALAITAQGHGFGCTSARAVVTALLPNHACYNAKLDSCTVRGFKCYVAEIGDELHFVRCENSKGTKWVRFDFGS